MNSQEGEDGGGDSGRLVSGPSVVSASSYDSGAAAVSQSKSGSIKVDEGDDVRVACAMIVRKQVCKIYMTFSKGSFRAFFVYEI